MSTKELYLKMIEILLPLCEIKGYSISTNCSNPFSCNKYISYFVHYNNDVIKNDLLTYNTKNLKDKLKELELFVDERVNKK